MNTTQAAAHRPATATYVAAVLSAGRFCWPVAIWLLCKALGG